MSWTKVTWTDSSNEVMEHLSDIFYLYQCNFDDRGVARWLDCFTLSKDDDHFYFDLSLGIFDVTVKILAELFDNPPTVDVMHFEAAGVITEEDGSHKSGKVMVEFLLSVVAAALEKVNAFD